MPLHTASTFLIWSLPDVGAPHPSSDEEPSTALACCCGPAGPTISISRSATAPRRSPAPSAAAVARKASGECWKRRWMHRPSPSAAGPHTGPRRKPAISSKRRLRGRWWEQTPFKALQCLRIVSEAELQVMLDPLGQAFTRGPYARERSKDMACKKVVRKVRTGKKPGPKTVPVRPHRRSKPAPCRK